MHTRFTLPTLYAVLAFIHGIPVTEADDACQDLAGHFLTIEGTVEVQGSQSGAWTRAFLDEQLCEGDTVRVGSLSRAAVSLVNDAVLRMDENTTMRLLDINPEPEERSLLDLLRGAFHSFSRKPRLLSVNTPYLNGSIEGTEFIFRANDDESILTVLEGTVVATNDQGSLAVTQGESAASAGGAAPQKRIMVSPRDAAQWALYYPPILAAAGDTSADQAPAMTHATQGDIAGALEALDGLPQDSRDAGYFTLRASLLLSVGRADAARSAIDQALAADPDSAMALAQRSIISLVQNDTEQALSDAGRAVELRPDSTAAGIALSYARQANFDLAGARDTLQTAVDNDPGNALAWARLSELWLMLGDRDQAIASAQKAVALDPDQSRSSITLGFAELARFDNNSARAAFENAIALDSADPLSRLGLGLAKISNGELDQGRADIEAAVALGSNNALYRAYLGKAYFDERRYPLDSEQFAIAKALDPNDPTAFLYDGILKQSVNRPIEAIEDFQRSIALNDNRAVYRGRLLLDEDRAARGASLARAYNDVGFAQLGINQATMSLSLDPSNASAHRFLSDTYQGTRRVEISRVSELLQAQLMQDVNINPVQPSIAATNLNIVTLGGPNNAGFNEFTPLFGQNQTQFNASGFGGNNETYGGEAAISGLHNRFSYSLGGFTSNTDGWRPNNGLDQDLYNAYFQGAITPEVNLQAEFQHRESEAGDLAFNFDPEDFLLDKTDTRDEDAVRLGLRVSPNPTGSQSTFLFSYIHNEREEGLSQSGQPDPFTTEFIDASVDSEGDQFEAQYIFQRDRTNVIAGVAFSETDTNTRTMISVEDVDLGPVFAIDDATTEMNEHPRGYVYTSFNNEDRSLDWTLGFSYDDYEEGILQESSFNPKVGALWRATDKLQVRAAAIKTMKPVLVNNRTIEPTQLAGFNQFYDDINGTKSWRYGLGLDLQAKPNLSVGASLTTRDLEEPVFIFFEDPPTVRFEEREEELHELYLYWTPSSRIGVSAKLFYDKFESEPGEATEFGNIPLEVETISLPLSISYFHPNGFFASLGGTFVDQEVLRSEASFQASGSDNFFVVDLGIGYRFAKRRGIASIGIKNLFDEEFSYQDDSYREFRGESSIGPYFPEHIVVARVSVSF